MLGWRARIGGLVPLENRTVEPELYRMAPARLRPTRFVSVGNRRATTALKKREMPRYS